MLSSGLPSHKISRGRVRIDVGEEAYWVRVSSSPIQVIGEPSHLQAVLRTCVTMPLPIVTCKVG